MPETVNPKSKVETDVTDDPILTGEEHHRKGCVLYEQGRYPEAITSLNDALLQGETAERWNDWGTVNLACSNYELAERGFRQALQLNPRDPQAALNLAVLLMLRERLTEALRLLDLCIECADESQRSAAISLREECAAAVSTRPHAPAESPETKIPMHLGDHSKVSDTDERVLDHLIEKFGIGSILVVGCGPGGMVHLAQQKGLRAVGVDSAPKVGQISGLETEDLIVHDFTQGPLDLDEEFDLVWSVGFLEHIEEQFQANYMPLIAQGQFVFCTGGLPVEPGIRHLNCRDSEYWRVVFRQHRLLYNHHDSETLRNVSMASTKLIRESGMLFYLDKEDIRERYTPQIPGQPELLQAALALVRPGDRLLDLGAGRCEATRLFAQAGCRVTALGMRFDRYLDGPARAELETLGVHLEDSSFEAYTESEPFDALWVSHILEHQRNPGWFLEQCLDLLRPGGWLLLSVPPSKTQVVSGHVNVWFPGLLLYHLVLTGLDCSKIHMAKIGYNIAAFVQNNRRPLPPLTFDLGDIELLADRFPDGLDYAGFEGEFEQLNWPPR